MKNKILVFSLCIIITGITILLINTYVNYQIKTKLDIINVPVALNDLGTRHLITENDIAYISVSKNLVSDDMLIDESLIINSYVSNLGFVFKGSFFYKSMLENQNEMNDMHNFLLEDDQVAFTLQENETDVTLSNFEINQFVDIYISIRINQSEVINDLFIENVKIIGIKDHNGNDVEQQSSAATVILAIEKDLISLLKNAQQLGEISLYSDSDTYNITNTCLLNKNNLIMVHLNQDLVLRTLK